MQSRYAMKILEKRAEQRGVVGGKTFRANQMLPQKGFYFVLDKSVTGIKPFGSHENPSKTTNNEKIAETDEFQKRRNIVVCYEHFRQKINLK